MTSQIRVSVRVGFDGFLNEYFFEFLSIRGIQK